LCTIPTPNNANNASYEKYNTYSAKYRIIMCTNLQEKKKFCSANQDENCVNMNENQKDKQQNRNTNSGTN